jgi:outer membrane protein TolC
MAFAISGSRRTSGWLLIWSLLGSGMGLAQEGAPEPLPEPLTLEHALSLAAESHHELRSAAAELAQAEAQALAAQADDDLDILLRMRLRYIEPSEVAINQTRDDNAAQLFVRKRLYDFGRTQAEREAADAAVSSRRSLMELTLRERRVEIMRRFFDVLLADLAYARDNEAMATAFVTMDRLQDRAELGEVSDVVVLEADTAYQRARQRRAVSAARQRSTRVLLAEALGRPGRLSADLVRPSLPEVGRPVPDLQRLSEAAMEHSPIIQAARAEVEAARRLVTAARAGNRPVLNGEVEVNEYNRQLASRDEWRVGVVLDIPLYRGNQVGADVAGAQARLQAEQARLQRLESELREQVLLLWQELTTQQVALEGVLTRQEFQELNLDRSRALYDLEVRTDLGDSMVGWSEARFERARVEFEIALAWSELEMLIGMETLQALLERSPSGGSE